MTKHNDYAEPALSEYQRIQNTRIDATALSLQKPFGDQEVAALSALVDKMPRAKPWTRLEDVLVRVFAVIGYATVLYLTLSRLL